MLVEADEFLKGVVAAPMGVAGAVREFLELAKRGASGARTKRRHYLGQRGDGLPAKQVAERSGGVLGRSHGGTITSTTIAIVPQRASGTHHTRHEQPSRSIHPANSNGLIASIYRYCICAGPKPPPLVALQPLRDGEQNESVLTLAHYDPWYWNASAEYSGVYLVRIMQEAQQLIVSAYERARSSGKLDWNKMTMAVLKNRLLDLTQGAFDETTYGATSFTDFVLHNADIPPSGSFGISALG